MGDDFLGVGWQFPIALDSAGMIMTSSYEESVRESILTIIGTARGERQMRPDFGCDIQRLVFSENTATTAAVASHYVAEALQRWEPRVEVLRVDGAPDADERNRLIVTIEYRVITTNNIFNLVYPFYLTEGVGG